MKNKYALIILAACIQPALAQITVEETVVVPLTPASEVVTETTIERTPEGDIITETVVPLDPRHHLLVLPRDAVVPEHPPGIPRAPSSRPQ